MDDFLGKLLRQISYFPISLMVIVEQKKQRLDLVLTDIEDYNCFLQLKEFLDFRKKSMVGY